LYGAERIAELLGLDKNALDFSPVEESEPEAASLVSWYDFRTLQTNCMLL